MESDQDVFVAIDLSSGSPRVQIQATPPDGPRQDKADAVAENTTTSSPDTRKAARSKDPQMPASREDEIPSKDGGGIRGTDTDADAGVERTRDLASGGGVVEDADGAPDEEARITVTKIEVPESSRDGDGGPGSEAKEEVREEVKPRGSWVKRSAGEPAPAASGAVQKENAPARRLPREVGDAPAKVAVISAGAEAHWKTENGDVGQDSAASKSPSHSPTDGALVESPGTEESTTAGTGEGSPEGRERPRFEGLLYYDTTDSRGHPVIVVNTSALPRMPFGATRARTAALKYMRDTLEPIVQQGPYVLIFTSFQVKNLSSVSATWAVSAYRKLSRPFKKNVKFIILVRPSIWLRGLLKVLSMVVKKKARNKVKVVRYLDDMALATGGEVVKEDLSMSVLKALEQTKDGLPIGS